MFPGFMGHVKLHIPGPVEVSEKTFRAFSAPMIGHRSQGFKDLYAKIQPQLQRLLSTKQLVYLSTSSAWGVMEGAIRILFPGRCSTACAGRFPTSGLMFPNAAAKRPKPSRCRGARRFAPNKRTPDSPPDNSTRSR